MCSSLRPPRRPMRSRTFPVHRQQEMTRRPQTGAQRSSGSPRPSKSEQWHRGPRASGQAWLSVELAVRSRDPPAAARSSSAICLLRSFSTAFAHAEALAATARSLRALVSRSTVGSSLGPPVHLQPPVYCGAFRLHRATCFSRRCPSEGWWRVPRAADGTSGSTTGIFARQITNRRATCGQAEHLKVWRSNPGIVGMSARTTSLNCISAPQAKHCIAPPAPSPKRLMVPLGTQAVQAY